MFGFIKNAFTPRRDHADCSGCSLCLLVCPVWRKTRDIALTPHGRAKAVQQGVAVDAASAESCTLCMACNPVCPEQIDQVEMILKLRRQQNPTSPPPVRGITSDLLAGGLSRMASSSIRAREGVEAELLRGSTPIPTFPLSGGRSRHGSNAQPSPTALLPDAALRAHPDTLARVIALLGGENICAGNDDGTDISLALEAGAEIPAQQLEQFLTPLRTRKKIVVADGLLLRYLKQWLPQASLVSLGEALSSHVEVRRKLRSNDLYVIEPRAYHNDYPRLVKYYDRLRTAHGCAFNLDLQRIAIPATARNLPQRLGLAEHDDAEHARWVLHGRNITRIVVESLEDRIAIEKVSDVPVVHLAELADDGIRV